MIHSIKIDDAIDERLKDFHARLPSNERVIDFKPHNGYLFIHTESKLKSNLLFEELAGRRIIRHEQ